jgi:hypothetical protein
MRVAGQRPASADLPPGKTPNSLCIGGLGGPQGHSGRLRKISSQPGFDPRTVQSVVSLENYNKRVVNNTKFKISISLTM